MMRRPIAALLAILLTLQVPLSAQTVLLAPSQAAYLDGLETLIGTTNTTLADIVDGTLQVQVSGSALTSLQLIDDAVSGTGFNISQLAGATTPMTTTQADNLALTLDGLNVTAFMYVYDGTNLDLLRVGTAGTAAAQVLTIQGIASGTAVTVSDGAGAMNVICDSGCSGGTQYAEDLAAVSADLGTLALAVRRDAAASSSGTDGDYSTLNVDASGRLWVNVATGSVSCSNCTGSGASDVDDSSFAVATDSVAPMGAMFDDVASDSIDEGDDGIVRMSANRNLYVTLRDSAGNERGVTVNASNQLSVAGPVTNAGTFVVQENGAALTALQLIDNPVFVDDAAFTVATSSGFAVGFQADEVAPDSVNEGDFGVARMTLNRELIVNPRDSADAALFGTAAALADNTSNPTLGAVASYMMCFDGSTWDRCVVAQDWTVSSAIGTTGPGQLLEAKDFDGAALPLTASAAEGDAIPAASSLYGITYVMLVSEDGSLQYGTSTTPLVVGDGSGALNIICDSGCSGGTQYTQDAALTVGTTIGTMAMGRASAAVPTDVSADGDAVLPWYLRSGAQATQPTYAGVLAVAGNGASGTGVQRVTIANDSTGILATVSTVTTLSQLGGVALPVEDAAETAAGVGIYAMSVRRDAAASSAGTDGDNATINTDALGRLWVNCGTGCSGGTQYTQDAALTVATTVGTMAMGRASAAVPTDVTADNDAVMPWFLRSGAMATQPTYAGVLGVAGNGASGTGVVRVTVANDSTGILAAVTSLTQLGGVAVPIEDAAETAAGTGIYAMGVRRDTQASSAGTTGDNTMLSFDATGNLWIASAVIEDAAETAANPLLGVGTVRRDTLASSAGTTGDNATLNTSGTGALWTAPTASTNGGADSLKYTSVGVTEDKHVVKATAGTLYSITTTNTNAAARYLRCENDTSANTAPGSETPELDLAIPGATAGAGFTTTFPVGYSFSTALTCWLVTGAADTDVAEVAANEIKVFYTFK